MEYGLIGKKLGHSFSRQIHEAMTEYSYDLLELPTEADVASLLQARAFQGINITIPYKETVLPLCDVLDASAKAIGAVNTIVNKNGTLVGYNTDFAGCRWALRRAGIALAGKNVLVLGSGGTQKTFCAVARAEGVATLFCASRTPRPAEDGCTWLTYDKLQACASVDVVLNATPVGMYPANGDAPVNLDALPKVSAVFDAIYNPFETALLRQAREKGCTCANGLFMLVAQAKYAAEYFLHEKIQIENSEIERVASLLRRQLLNLVLVGMPGSGKTTLGRAVAAALKKRFVDLDVELASRAKASIPDIFATQGEAAFREMESALCCEYGRQTGTVLSTGGGVVLRRENVQALEQNAVIIYLRKAVATLATVGRPLSQGGLAALEEMAQARAPLYEAAADRTIENNASAQMGAQAVLEAFYEAVDCEWA